MPSEYDFPWMPQPTQLEGLELTGLAPVLWNKDPERPVARLIGYGGAAFGGKTDLGLGVAGIAAMTWPGCKIGFFRRTFSELEGADGAIERSLELFPGLGTYNKGNHTWTFFNGSKLYFCHCQNEGDRTNYQSQAWDILIIDEATHFTWIIVDYLITRNRPTGDFEGLVPFTLMMTNPGNIGHAWFMDIFDTTKQVGPHKEVKRRLTPNSKYEYTVFLPAFLEDNPIGLSRDPEYPDRLEARDPVVARALRHGDWLVFAGQAFPIWNRERHVINPFLLPEAWPKWRGMDYGLVHPTAVYWLAQDPDNGRVFVYRELHQAGLSDTQQARRILAMTPEEELIWFTYAAPDMWAKKTVKDIVTTTAEEFADEGVILTRANNDRLQGKRNIDRALSDGPDGKPMLQVFSTCSQLVRTMPLLVYDENHTEDVKKMNGIDDPYDALRYGFSSVHLKPRRKKRKNKEAPIQAVSVL
jgi:phage terminase large subunit